ncbi:ribosome silencing factor [Pseudobacteriovorax antillogorgiicola]|uniref:Ribosomal silencing factor RsfS n=1 Tax=Pseudobacteriovorax antillogorgiicola TaxID=1513793 RepID=A0A1Y6CI20_9BACT|nr:ribosome silencing factor [Pseudobacteriovorax antillogorgiicola]TCS46706.1 ribosome-associated protein [Pseudobacteriovorax antillogorgiicola]SMF66959.1 ribosome-associated protein [Pseudobacteriovorax antillogorgiicola]
MNNLDIAKAIGKAAQDKKASRLVIQDLRNRSDICDYQVVCSASSDRQTQAICSSIEEYLKKNLQVRPIAIEGKQTGHWILIDYGSVIVHVFLEEIRDYYALEDLWSDADLVHLED